MMKIYYSASEPGFYPEGHPQMPMDAVLISAKAHAALIDAQNSGQAILPDAKGKPNATPPSADDLRAEKLDGIKAECEQRCLAILPITAQINAIRSGETKCTEEFGRIDAIRAASQMIEDDLAKTENCADFPIADHPLWPDFAKGDNV